MFPQPRVRSCLLWYLAWNLRQTATVGEGKKPHALLAVSTGLRNLSKNNASGKLKYKFSSFFFFSGAAPTHIAVST